jgi:glycosyltransferase involved in cell wall biosynthesis
MAAVRVDRVNLPPITIFAGEIEAFGGAERSLLALSRWLYEREMPHRLVLYYDSIKLSHFSDHPIEIVLLDPEPQPREKIAALKAYFKRECEGSPKPLMSGIQSAFHASLAGLEGFHTLMHDTPSLLGDPPRALAGRLRDWVSNRAMRRGLNSGGATIVTSEYLKAEAARLWHPPVEIARMGGIQAKAFHRRPPGTQLRMLSVSRVEANKRIDWLLRSLGELENRAPRLSERIDWVFDIVGGGSQIGQLTQLSWRLGIADRVAFHDFVDDAHLEGFYDRADLFLMPARQGYGIPAAEALSRGIPVLLHGESGISDILRDTPWAMVMEGSETWMTDILDSAIAGVLEGDYLSASPPALPTEAGWAEQVARICGWYGGADD